MTNTRTHRSFVSFVLVAATAAASLVILAAPADASFPGRNGRIAFRSLGAKEEILAMRPDGSGVRVLLRDGSQPAWAPHGNRIAFRRSNPETGAGSIWIAEADGTHPHRVTRLSWDASQPAWAPDGEHIAFIAYRGGDTDLAILDLTTGEAAVVRDNHAFEFEPSWSPDGSLIAFSSDRLDGVLQIYVAAPDGSNLERLTTSTYDSQPNWSPDGSMIAFQSDRDDPSSNYDIYVMQADGSDVERLTSQAGTDAHPAWSPNGTKIVYARDQTAVVVMDVDGSDKTRLYARTSAIISNPDWQPRRQA